MCTVLFINNDTLFFSVLFKVVYQFDNSMRVSEDPKRDLESFASVPKRVKLAELAKEVMKRLGLSLMETAADQCKLCILFKSSGWDAKNNCWRF